MRSAIRTGARGGPRRFRRRSLLAALCALSGLAATLLPAVPAPARTSASGPPAPARAAVSGAPAAPPAPPLDARRLASFFDAYVPARLRDDHVPGMTISVVSDGRTVFAKGYGQADVEDGRPFDPATSLVRIASISKLFTWTAVMQLVEQGRLDLNTDVNRYLTTFHIPSAYGRPITLLELMSHSSGFEDRNIGAGGRTKADVPPLGTYLAHHIPARVRPPGEVSSYSNYGAALAGYIVAQVSGESYEQYVKDHILGPLGMRHTTAREPVPAALAGDVARSYEYAHGRYERRPFVFDKGRPDGSISTTADDMARFMTAHLQDGRLGRNRILGASTAALMHQRSFSTDPRLDGWAHGFKERTFNGHHAITHDGSWEAFESEMLLVPDARLGLFVSTNSIGGIDAVTDLNTAFFDRFLPQAGPPAATGTAAGAPSSPPRAGFYRPAYSTESTIAKLLILVGSSRLRVRGDGKVEFGNKTWEPIGPDLYRQTGDTDRLSFVSGRFTGRTYVATDAGIYERLPWQETIRFNLLVLLGFAVVALSAVLGFPLTAAVRRLTGRRSKASRPWRVARWTAVAAALGGIVFTTIVALTLVGDTSDFVYGVPTTFRLVLVLPVLFTALTAVSVVTTAVAWRRGRAGIPARVHQVALLAGMLAMVWFCLEWNLLGWHLG